MKLLLKQKFWSWFDSFDIRNESGEVEYLVKGQLAWGHAFKIFDKRGNEIAEVRQRLWSWSYRFDIIQNGIVVGEVHKQITWFKPKFDISFNSKVYDVDGNWMQWDYEIKTGGVLVADIHKEIWNWTDTYSINVNEKDALTSVILVVAIDAIKCVQQSANS
ncbi:MAG: hypothetical protein MJ220_04100 [Bacilli bacterium]|nr:hypothetical protein [Bacilli bacterium]